jgi:hypothetical protein
MGLDFVSAFYEGRGELEDWLHYHPKGREKVLLREAEVCRECGSAYQSLYPLKSCIDHEGLEPV